MRKSNLHKRMYAVSLEGVGIIAGTMAYSRRAAIDIFTPHGNWEEYKGAGYSTVMARVEVIRRWAVSQTDRGGK
jgi:hypothetical protein